MAKSKPVKTKQPKPSRPDLGGWSNPAASPAATSRAPAIDIGIDTADRKKIA